MSMSQSSDNNKHVVKYVCCECHV
uniref:Macaca fascicularis brain cDNA, clone: QtrA-16678 n=1 Tax=Macaca fascicularis TaxID=9541 RepID=I7G4L0_MACFA|nr:unnamed protein product [Macaca fascicularis]